MNLVLGDNKNKKFQKISFTELAAILKIGYNGFIPNTKICQGIN